MCYIFYTTAAVSGFFLQLCSCDGQQPAHVLTAITLYSIALQYRLMRYYKKICLLLYTYIVHNEERHALYSSPNIICSAKSRRLRWGTGKVHTGCWWRHLREGDHLGDPGEDGRTILKWILDKWDGGNGLDRSGSGQEPMKGSSECGNEPSSSIKYGGIS
jgi:hypothetical protein